MTAMSTLAVIAAVAIVVGIASITHFVREMRKWHDFYLSWGFLVLGVAAFLLGAIWMVPPAVTLWDSLQ